MTPANVDAVRALLEVVRNALFGDRRRVNEVAAIDSALDLLSSGPSKGALRTRRWRDKKGATVTGDVTVTSPTVTCASRVTQGDVTRASPVTVLSVTCDVRETAKGACNSSPDLVLLPDPAHSESSIVSTPSELLPAKPASSRSARARAETPTAETWQAYSAAYAARYVDPVTGDGIDPVRNARVNSQMSQFVGRIGKDEAPHVAAWYVRSNNARYVQAGHSVGCLLHDAEKLRTEWAARRQVTASAAQRIDRTADRLNGYEAAKAQLRAEAEEEARNHGR